MSPDGEAIVTGAGDETLRFWNVFSKMRSTKVMFPHMLMMSEISCSSSPAGHLTHVSPVPLFLGIRVCAEPLHQDPVVISPLSREGINPERDLMFACVKL